MKLWMLCFVFDRQLVARNVRKNVRGRMSERMSEEMSERLSEDMSEEMSDKSISVELTSPNPPPLIESMSTFSECWSKHQSCLLIVMVSPSVLPPGIPLFTLQLIAPNPNLTSYGLGGWETKVHK